MNISTDTAAMSLEQFWSWASMHYNCIIRAGNESCLAFDQPYIHWHLAREEGMLFVQLLRGKDLILEFVIDPTMVLYVEATPQTEDEQVLFDLVGNIQGEPLSIFHFLMAHGYEDEEGTSARKWTH